MYTFLFLEILSNFFRWVRGEGVEGKHCHLNPMCPPCTRRRYLFACLFWGGVYLPPLLSLAYPNLFSPYVDLKEREEVYMYFVCVSINSVVCILHVWLTSHYDNNGYGETFKNVTYFPALFPFGIPVGRGRGGGLRLFNR